MSSDLQARNVMVSYDGIVAVDDVSLTVARGQIVTVVGANGAGKTTLLNAIMGVVRSDGGVMFENTRLDNLSVEARASQGHTACSGKARAFRNHES
jgi:branched-chain amino acid transport system ATP-binding protein